VKALLSNIGGPLDRLWREHALPYYRQLQERERRIVLSAGLLLPVLIVIFGFWLPLRDDAAAIRASLPEMQAQLAEARLLADKVATGGGAQDAPADLLSGVDAAARSSQIRQFITRIKPQPGLQGQRVLVQLRKVPYDGMVRFLGAMAGQGAATERAKLSDVGANGLVDVDITFSTP